MNFWEWYDRNLLAAKQHDVPVYELDWLVLRQTQLDKLDLRLRSPNITQKITPSALANLDRLWHQRLSDRVPVQYLTGSVTWRDLELAVTPAVLIPRPETELIIDLVAELVAQSSQAETYHNGIWVDLGTGSGAIAIALAKHFPQAQIHAIDLSESALEIAQINADKHGQQIQFHHGSWFEPLAKLNLQNKLAAVVSNPPYIPSHEVLKLQPEVTNHEPHSALDGGKDGLDDIRNLVNAAPEYLISGGLWIVEMMSGQAETVRSLLQVNGSYSNIQVHQDYAGIERFVSANLTYSYSHLNEDKSNPKN
ncbi:peptide chain release factor N(5)-glutamine methyltransferase [Pseudanabaena sp. UWO310]|uniref:peptide chain release factor N(5)-glutamine methyltransferase n=1 Tax=Pseudanabaena sp. UWO310 TaxID=2480795 RepID=UPI00115929D3|nr:peptide chain release factor N(5)-glutamine methyltransferase [Pseudanabaena sp. UWO310]TYQ29782.1 peptide chain release factor N(5)-glutamine methyltransferase [Pseudanabaena sp. UWO310]